MRSSLAILLVIVLAGCRANGSAPVLSELGARSWGAATELTPSEDLNSFVRNAQLLNTDKWKATLYPKTGGEDCSATLVGPEVLLTAAHCIADGGTASFAFNGESYSGLCAQAEPYKDRSDRTADYALCKVAPAVTGIPFERINLDGSELSDQREIMLTGFGCVHDNGTGGNDGNLWGGTSNISQPPIQGANQFKTTGGAALCFGDSGSGAYLEFSGNRRVLVGVNRKVQSDGGVGISNISVLSSVSSNTAKQFIQTWAGKHGSPLICNSSIAPGGTPCHN